MAVTIAPTARTPVKIAVSQVAPSTGRRYHQAHARSLRPTAEPLQRIEDLALSGQWTRTPPGWRWRARYPAQARSWSARLGGISGAFSQDNSLLEIVSAGWCPVTVGAAAGQPRCLARFRCWTRTRRQRTSE